VPYLENTVFAHSQQISALNTTQRDFNFTMQGKIENLEAKMTALNNTITALEIALIVLFALAILSSLIAYKYTKKAKKSL
jgi:hypothetical protein